MRFSYILFNYHDHAAVVCYDTRCARIAVCFAPARSFKIEKRKEGYTYIEINIHARLIHESEKFQSIRSEQLIDKRKE